MATGTSIHYAALIARGAEDAALARRLEESSSAAGLRLISFDDIAAAKSQFERDAGSALVVLFSPSVPNPGALARELRPRLPHADMIFIADDNVDAMQRQLRAAPILGNHWRVVAGNAPNMKDILRVAAQAAAQRAQLRATLDRVNATLARSSAGDDRSRAIVSERYLASILTYAADGIIGLAADGTINSWNVGAERIFGYSENEIVGRGLHCLAADSATTIGSWLLRLQQGESSVHGEMSARRNNGTFIEIELAFTNIEDGSQHLGVAAIVRDVTERKRHERRRAAQYEITRILSEATTWDTAAPTVLRALCANIGWEYGALWSASTATSAFTLQSQGHDGDAAVESFARASSGFNFARGEGLPGRVAASGKALWLSDIPALADFPRRQLAIDTGFASAVAFPVAIDNATVAVIECFSRSGGDPDPDLIELMTALGRQISQFVQRKHAEALLAQERERLAVTLQSIGDGVIATDITGKIVMMNAVAERLTGWDIADAAGRPMTDVFRIINEHTRQPCENPVTKVLQSDEIVGLANHTALIARDGTERVIADSGAPIRNSAGHVIGVVLVFRDITEQQRLENELHKARNLESIGVLAGGIAHDFNNILTAILGNIALARMYTQNDAKVSDVLLEAENAFWRARDLTQQLLTFAKGGAPIKQTASLAELLIETTAFALRGSTVRYAFDIAPDLSAVNIDRGQISQVVSNIVINAQQAMPDGGDLKITATNIELTDMQHPLLPAGRYVRIEIADSGVGIPERYLQKIFDPYFTTKQQGSGLGLATVYSIVQKHDGHIDVRSTVGVGTVFGVYLPAAETVPPAAPTDTRETLTGSGRILIMDDERAVREALAGLLRGLGYEPVAVPDGETLLEIYMEAKRQRRPFAAVIMDLTVPGAMGGKACIERLHKIDPNVKAIVSSGYSNDPVMANYRDYGFVSVMSKPYHLEELARTLKATIDAPPLNAKG